MGKSAHATHVYITDNDTGRLIATALLKSVYSLVICKPYDKWINAYLPMGLSYKDVKDFPTATCLELNCVEGESIEIKFFTSDRLAFEFESGIADAAEAEDQLLQIASDLWAADNPELVEKARLAMRKAHETASDEDDIADHNSAEDVEKAQDFWSLSEADKQPFMDKAKESEDYKKFIAEAKSENHIPSTESLEKIIPEGHSRDELDKLIQGIASRTTGPPSDDSVKSVVEKFMGKDHSDEAMDYIKALGKFFGVRASAWSLETIEEEHGDKIDRRIVPIEVLES